MSEDLMVEQHKRPVNRAGLVFALFWTLLICGLLYVRKTDVDRAFHESTYLKAVDLYRKDLAFRLWAAEKGGVYVPVTEHTKPSSYLKNVPEQNVSTPSGKTLTLMSPARMMRQLQELGRKEFSFESHITSLEPLRPENKADEWERNALRAIHSGSTEIFGMSSFKGEEYYRLIRPLTVNKSCIACHGHQGYKVGEIRGGICVSIPAGPLHERFENDFLSIIAGCILLWLIGLVGILFGVKYVGERIKERSEAEARAKAVHCKFQEMLDNTRIQLWCFNGYTFDNVNLAWFSFSGIDSSTELTLSVWKDLIHQEDLDSFFLHWNRHWEAKSEFDIHLRMRRHDGIYRHILCHGVPVFKDTGDFSHYQGYNIDITLQKEAEREKDKLIQAIEQVRESIVITDIDGTVTYVNPVFSHITGYSAEEVVGENPRILKSGFHDSDFYASMWETLTSGKTWNGRMTNKKKNGSLYLEEATISPIHVHHGKVVGYIGVKRDITESVKLQEAYQQAQKVESIGRLAGGVAHDLNNLLSPIIGYGEILLEDLPEDEVCRDSVNEILRAGFKARDLVSQLLAFSRKQTLEYKVVDLNTVVKDFKSLLRRTIREDVEIEVETCNEEALVYAEKGQLEQVLMNLSVNSQDAMPSGGTLTISVSVTESSGDTVEDSGIIEEGSYVVLSISDTGHGIDAETRKHMFDPFFSTKGKKGTGLGLSTVYGIVKQHNGHIVFCSGEGTGTKAKIYLPLSSGDVFDESQLHSYDTSTSSHGTIVLVEDDPQVRNLTLSILERQGFRVLYATNGREALELLRSLKEPVDLLLTDVVMPEMNGKELYVEAIKELPDLKVLYMSGYTNDVVAVQGILEEGVALLDKPFTVSGLVQKIDEIMGPG